MMSNVMMRLSYYDEQCYDEVFLLWWAMLWSGFLIMMSNANKGENRENPIYMAKTRADCDVIVTGRKMR